VVTTENVTVETDEATYFRIHYVFPAAVLDQVENWRDGVCDECVQQAHMRMLMPVGEVLCGDPEPIERPRAGMEEGVRFGSFTDMVISYTPMVRVTAEVLLMGGMA
jgi:hypothetical protein